MDDQKGDFADDAGGDDMSVETLEISGGRCIVGGVTKAAARTRLSHMKYVPDDEKKMLAVIGMSHPIGFGRINWDDGSSGFIIPKGTKRIQPAEALKKNLEARLVLEPAAVAKHQIKEFGLDEPAHLAIVDTIHLLAEWLAANAPTELPVAINGDIGRLLSDIPGGDRYFEIETHSRSAPCTTAELITNLLMRLPDCEIELPGKLDHIPWPDTPVLDSMPQSGISGTKKELTTTRDYVQAIVDREQQLVGYIDSIERYYIGAARDIQKFNDSLRKCLGRAQPAKK